MPMESEKNACPKAVSTVAGPIFEKSGFKKNFSPSAPLGISSEWMASATKMTKSSGISTLAERSIPFCTPSAMMKWVARMNTDV